MPKSDTWPGGVAMESLSNTDSAGSWDSVISTNSGSSDDSMEHLTAEERACLMYLEETIEALEVQEDSGFSNDELDVGLQTDKMGVNDISSLKSHESGSDQKSDRVDLHTLNQTSEPQSSPVANAVGKVHPKASQTGVLCVAKDEDGKLKIVSSASLRSPGPSTKAPGVDLGVMLPPPSDFMDEPNHPPQPEIPKHLPPPVPISRNKPGATVDLEMLRQRASVKTTPAISSPPVTHDPPNKPPELILFTDSPGPLMIPIPEAAELRSPPAVAPKPKRLPSNIILKSHKACDGPSSPSSERGLSDRERIHMEALRKLGLLKMDQADSDSSLSPRHSPQTRRSWAAPPSPLPTPPSTPSYTRRVNSPSPVPVPPQSPVALVSASGASATPACQSPDILPAPAAFSDPGGHLLSDEELSEGGSEATLNTPLNTPPLTPTVLVKQLTPPKFRGGKSATLERSGLGLSSYMDSQTSNMDVSGKQRSSTSQLRNNRPRPASLGSRKEFSGAQAESSQMGLLATHKEPDLRRSLPVFQHTGGESQKLPRSQGISVLICPRSENVADRRDALKRLGLLRD